MSVLFDAAGKSLSGSLTNGPTETQWRLITAWVKQPSAMGLGSINTIVAIGDATDTITSNLYPNSTPIMICRGSNGGGTYSGASGNALPRDSWQLVAYLAGPNDGVNEATHKSYVGIQTTEYTQIDPSAVQSRVVSLISIGANLGDTTARFRGYVAEVAVWAPTSKTQANQIVTECLTKVPTAVTVATPRFYAELRNSATVDVGGSLTANGAPSYFADHPTLDTGGPTVTLTPNPVSVNRGSLATVTITRSVAAPTGGIQYSLQSSNTGVATVPASVTMSASQTTVQFSVTGVGGGSATITALNAADQDENGSTDVTVVVVKALKLLVEAAAAGATGVNGVVYNAPVPGLITGSKLGEFQNASFSGTLENGKAVLTVPVNQFTGSDLSAGTEVVVLVRNSQFTTGLTSVDATIIEL